MACQRTRSAREECASRQSSPSSKCPDPHMMDEVLTLLLQDSSGSDEDKRGTLRNSGAKDCGVPGQHCGSEDSDCPETGMAARQPPAAPVDAEHTQSRSISDTVSLLVRQPALVRMDFASVFRTSALDQSPPITASAARTPLGSSAAGTAPTNAILELTAAEFEPFKKRLRTQEASRRYRRRKKDTLRQQKQEIQSLRDELARFHSIEADIAVMNQQSPATVAQHCDVQAHELREKLEDTRAAAAMELAVIQSTQDYLCE